MSDDPQLALDYSPWLYWSNPPSAVREAQQHRHRELAERADVSLGEDCYLSPLASIEPVAFRLGDRCYVAAHAYVTGTVSAGDNCTFNVFSVVRGAVTMGDGVRVGAHTSILGFNHSTAPDKPVYQQPLTSRGISIGDDVWIGSNAVVLDGVSIGEHSVVGAGAVVTKDVAPWSVVAGNPARRIRDRRGTPDASSVAERLRAFADTARDEAEDVLQRSWDATVPDGRYLDRPGAPATVRAHCDAIEIADLLLGTTPPQLPKEAHVRRLQERQDRVTGLVPEIAGPREGRQPLEFGAGPATYHVLSVGYALDLMGSRFPWPVEAVRSTTADGIVAALEALPWHSEGWGAGAWVDAWATAAHWNLGQGAAAGSQAAEPGALEALFGWLLTRANPAFGTWGEPTSGQAALQVINGYYRLTRGSFAQFDVPVPYPERLIDAVLKHGADPRYFADGRQNACNVLDVAHPLWLAGRQSPHRASDVQAWARGQLDYVLTRWQPGAGMAFGLTPESGADDAGLQGTEMWLAIVWYLADLLGESDALGYRPRGVHRPEPARALPRL